MTDTLHPINPNPSPPDERARDDVKRAPSALDGPEPGSKAWLRESLRIAETRDFNKSGEIMHLKDEAVSLRREIRKLRAEMVALRKSKEAVHCEDCDELGLIRADLGALDEQTTRECVAIAFADATSLRADLSLARDQRDEALNDKAQAEAEAARQYGVSNDLADELNTLRVERDSLKAEVAGLFNERKELRRLLERPIAAEGHEFDLLELASACADTCDAFEREAYELEHLRSLEGHPDTAKLKLIADFVSLVVSKAGGQ